MGKDHQTSRLHAVKAIKDDLTVQLAAARKAQADKLEQSRLHLANQLDVTSLKYLTVNGYMQARTTISEAMFDDEEVTGTDELARHLAHEMSELVCLISTELEQTKTADLDGSILEKYLDKTFVNAAHSLAETVQQLLVVHLLQNLGPALTDIVAFRISTDEAIASLEAEFAKTEEKN
jgi:L-lactate utilization protein LutC